MDEENQRNMKGNVDILEEKVCKYLLNTGLLLIQKIMRILYSYVCI